MDGPNNILDLARSASAISPYQPMSSSTVSSIVSTSPSTIDSTRRPLNGWNYSSNDSTVMNHGGCNFTPYTPSLGASNSVPGSHKPTYSSFSTSSDFLSPANCQQMQLNQLSPLNSLPPRQFPFYGPDMYNTQPPGMTSGGSLFSDITTIPTIPRFDSECPPTYSSDLPQNPGKAAKTLLSNCFPLILNFSLNQNTSTWRYPCVCEDGRPEQAAGGDLRFFINVKRIRFDLYAQDRA